jgi:hypothetical protein
MPQFNFQTLSKLADNALNYLTEGQRLLRELEDNYADARDALSEDDKEKLEAKLAEVRSKSAEVHQDIQQQG